MRLEERVGGVGCEAEGSGREGAEEETGHFV